MKKLILIALLFSTVTSYCQEHGFSFGQISLRELDMNVYEKDTAAAAVVLDEFGEAYIDNGNDNNLIFEHHIKIKILKQRGVEEANFEIPLYKQTAARTEKLRSVKASSFNRSGNSWTEDKLNEKNVFLENVNKYYDLKKFAVPNVRVGTVIEVVYQVESPFIFKFRSWEFQSHIPKVRSEYWATIPGNYIYNITLKGFLKLTKNGSELVKSCFEPGGGQKADCARYKYAITDVPSLIEEDYMTAKSNFLSSINFELSEIRYFNGRIDRITKEWKDAEEELRREEKFGLQIKRGKDIVDEHIESIIAGESDPLTKAKRIYDFIKYWYQWDEVHATFSELGIKKAFDSKKGNTGDINLSLIAALRYADLKVEPVILSTRQNGLPIDIHPVLSDFNYVIAKLNLNDKSYLLDATDDFLTFGMIPEKCINGKGRVLGDKESYWIEMKPTDKSKQISVLTLKLENSGKIKGTIQNNYIGYEAMNVRKKIKTFSNEKEYIDDLENKFDQLEITKYELKNVDDLDKAVTERLEVEINAFDGLNANNFLFSPFITEKWSANPFKSSERLYPVDFGVPIEETVIITMEYPSEFTITDLPEKVALAMPNAGGRYIFEVKNEANKMSMNSSLIISKTVYTSEEYHYLKELFNRIVSAQNTDLVFNKK